MHPAYQAALRLSLGLIVKACGRRRAARRNRLVRCRRPTSHGTHSTTARDCGLLPLSRTVTSSRSGRAHARRCAPTDWPGLWPFWPAQRTLSVLPCLCSDTFLVLVSGGFAKHSSSAQRRLRQTCPWLHCRPSCAGFNSARPWPRERTQLLAARGVPSRTGGRSVACRGACHSHSAAESCRYGLRVACKPTLHSRFSAAEDAAHRRPPHPLPQGADLSAAWWRSASSSRGPSASAKCSSACLTVHDRALLPTV